jgi:NAD+ dependent glucose-6-phosphate dehydrogenase
MADVQKKKIAITGGCGVIGTILAASLNRTYDITCLDLDVPPNDLGMKSKVVDIRKLDALVSAFQGQEIVVHLAADVRTEADWESVYSANINGTYNVFEAVRRTGVKRVVFASSNHVTGLYEKDWPISSVVKGDYLDLDPATIPKISHLTPPKADSFYGAGKLLGEGLGQYYSGDFGLSVICLRIGTVRPYEWPKPSEKRFFSTWLSHGDLVQLVQKSIEAPETVRYDVFYGVSNNTWRFWDIEHGRQVIGFEPQDNAEDHRQQSRKGAGLNFF